MEAIERELIGRALRGLGGNQKQAARYMDMRLYQWAENRDWRLTEYLTHHPRLASN